MPDLIDPQNMSPSNPDLFEFSKEEACNVKLTPGNVFLSTVLLICFIVSLIGNSIVIVVIICKRHRPRSITNFYLLNLAVADLLRTVVCIPSTLLSELTHCWLLGSIACKIIAYTQPVGVCASAYTLAVISVERYYAICLPLESRKWHTKKRALITISLVWIFSFVVNIGSLIIFDAFPTRLQITCDTTKGHLVDFIYQFYVTFAKIVLAKRKVTRMLIALVVVFAACWVPSYAWWLFIRAADLMGMDVWNSGLNSVLTILTYISSMANPVTYCFMNKSFRTSVFSCYKKTNSSNTKRRMTGLATALTLKENNKSRKSDKDRVQGIPLIKVILKTINLHGMSQAEEGAMRREVELLQKVQHPMIIGYYDFFTVENQLTIVMQYAEGGTMEKMITEQNGVHFQEPLVLNYFTQILIALNHMHSKQIVHRDLKPQNILLNRKKTMIKLSDFGISKELSTRSVASTVIGTPNYLSPEICEGRAYNQKSDMWSLGCVLYELLALKRAFDGENLPSIVMRITKCSYQPIGDHASAAAQHLVESLLQLNEKKRPDVKGTKDQHFVRKTNLRSANLARRATDYAIDPSRSGQTPSTSA
ncbi:hypothetical protein WR25_07354 isoform F [Diploscapter pachys]|uniref:non-specific serine/threonine protein kinase n=1 Tax=Diploscapter pachys TaxID=2018661 RepID=A0A2A2KB99_9BILA|nr:hypothetical protein WR25_07354 isoform C [Diploscapter pachys]PAV71162.1 hypothetical protein WR25_07354 isoform F [Diploscapter pachys]